MDDETNESISVLILEDDRIIARDIYGIVESLGAKAKMAHTYEQALAVSNEMKPDLLLCDINLRDKRTGIDLANEIFQELTDVKIIFISAHSDKETLESVLKINPTNFLVKPFNKKQLITTLNITFQEIRKKAAQQDHLILLSNKERAVLKLIAQQKSSKEIADALFISEKTVRNHRYNICKKLKLSEENNSLLVWSIKYFSAS